MILSIVNSVLLMLLVLLVGLYFARFRNLEATVFSPAAAWLRAGIFFCCCFLASWITGTQKMILEAPLVTEEQLQNMTWLAWTAGFVTWTVFGYWGIWARHTMRFDRQSHLLSQIPFGMLWGLSVGQFILIVWRTVTSIGALWPDWLVIAVTWISAGSIFATWMLFYWDLHIAPEHDSRYSIILKTIVVHIPQTLLSVIYVTLYNNFLILIGIQTIALVGATIYMRMPPFWSKKPTPLARKYRLPFGLVYAGGYVSADPDKDRYLKAAHLPY